MKRYLIITPMDVCKFMNNRELHLIRHLSPRFEETFVVYRKHCDRAGWRQFWLDALVPRARVFRDGSICYVEVNPLFNHYQGLARDISGVAGDGLPPKRSLGSAARHVVFLLSSGLGLFKDLSTICFLAYFAWRRAPGHFDVCTAAGPWAAMAARVLRRLGKVILYVYEDIDFEPGFIPTPLRSKWATWLEKSGLRHADLRICVGYRLARLREHQTGRPVNVVTNGVNLEHFPTRRHNGPTPVLIYTGNVTYWSGLDMVLQALPAIRSALPGTMLRIVGMNPHDYRQYLDALVERYGLQTAVEFVGRIPYDRVGEMLAGAHIGIATFRTVDLRVYAFPFKVVEYMAAGLPTVGTAGTETEDILKRHDFGLAVGYDGEQFSRAVIDLLGDQARYDAMASNARAAASKYDWKQLMKQEYQLIHEAWEALPPPHGLE